VEDRCRSTTFDRTTPASFEFRALRFEGQPSLHPRRLRDSSSAQRSGDRAGLTVWRLGASYCTPPSRTLPMILEPFHGYTTAYQAREHGCILPSSNGHGWQLLDCSRSGFTEPPVGDQPHRFSEWMLSKTNSRRKQRHSTAPRARPARAGGIVLRSPSISQATTELMPLESVQFSMLQSLFPLQAQGLGLLHPILLEAPLRCADLDGRRSKHFETLVKAPSMLLPKPATVRLFGAGSVSFYAGSAPVMFTRDRSRGTSTRCRCCACRSNYRLYS
jgi:hypothetical protein